MPGPSKLERARMNKHLQSHGLGSLDDPTILLQLAVLVRDHEHFRTVLMKVTAEERANCYKALAPKLRFKAKPLEIYEMEAKKDAERMRLPVYDPKTLAVTDMPDARVSEEMAETISGKSAEERKQAELERRASDAISENMGMEQPLPAGVSRGRLEITCNRCQFGVTVYALDRIDAYKTLAAAGWKIEGEKARCPDCSPRISLT